MSADLKTLYTGLIIVNILVLPILLLLMVQVLRRKHRTTDLKIFFRMLVMNMLYSLAYISGFLLLFNEDKLNSTFAFAGAVICNTVLGVIPILLVSHWMVFVEFTLHQSMDIIRRRYPVIMIPFWIGIVISIFNMIAVIPRSTPLLVLQITTCSGALVMLIRKPAFLPRSI